jgi:hypothetical protein
MNEKNLDREILLKMTDRDFLLTCNLSKFLRETVCDENFFRRRLALTYPDTLNYKPDNKTWRQYYIETVFYVTEMEEKYNFKYVEYNHGNPKKQYFIFKYVENKCNNDLLIQSSERGELALVIEALKRGVNIHTQDDNALKWASFNGHFQVVKYLVEQGANIHAENDYALREASYYGHLEVVKYLVEHGADIHAEDDYALKWASYYGHLEVVKYLKSI